MDPGPYLASPLASINKSLLEHKPTPGIKISNLVGVGGVVSEEKG